MSDPIVTPEPTDDAIAIALFEQFFGTHDADAVRGFYTAGHRVIELAKLSAGRVLPSTGHDHSGEPMVWCMTHQHQHIASIPRFTYLCKSCGWGQWMKPAAEVHERACPGHETYEVEHVIRVLPSVEELTEVIAVARDKWNYTPAEEDMDEFLARAVLVYLTTKGSN